MNTLYVDISSGVSGDMLLAACLDCGVPLAYLQEQLARLPVDAIGVTAQRQDRNGISCLQMQFSWDEQHQHRHLDDLLKIIETSGFSRTIRDKSKKILLRLGQAEAAVHNVPLEQVHFHEIGALDTLVDIVGFCLACEYLQVGEVLFSTFIDGCGAIATEHGVMPVPVPATAHLLQGFVLETCKIPTELITPTGASILTALGRQIQTMPPLTIVKTGYGCGMKIFTQRPNLLRVFLLASQTDARESVRDEVWILESDLDHISGEIMGHTAQLLLDQGALDASFIPLFMKKGRPGFRLSVLCTEAEKGALIDTIMVATRTLGVREARLARTTARREAGVAELCGQPIKTKHCSYKGYSFTKPEYESLAGAAKATGKSLMDLMEEYIKNQAS